MKEERNNIIRAIFLLVVFSLNTIAGFACSIGIDMGYNANHHAHATQVHKKANSHHHDHKAPHKHDASKEESNHHDCCSDEVTKFIQLDKSLASGPNLQVPVFIVPFTATYTLTEDAVAFNSVNSRFQFVRRSCFLNDMDIQTAIRRFQI
jgi:hypothetical protein